MKILTDFGVVCCSLCLNTLTTGGGCRRKSHEKGAANDVAASSILCVAYCPYLYSKYRLCAANVLYAHSSNDCLCRFPLHPLSISAHHAGGGGREHYVLLRWNMFCEDSRVCERKQMPSSLADGAFARSACLRKYMSGAACARGMVKALRS